MNDEHKTDGLPIQEQRGNNGENAKLPGGITGRGFRPGQSGNAGGRPKDRSITAQLRRALTPSRRAELAEKIIAMALEGDGTAIKTLLDRHDGSVRSVVDLSMVEAPQPGDGPQSFYERLKIKSLELVKRHFPGTDTDSLDVQQIKVIVEDAEESISTN